MNFFALEPEVASLYCSQDKTIDPNYILPGKTFTICDLGGWTGDILLLIIKIKKEKYLKNIIQ